MKKKIIITVTFSVALYSRSFLPTPYLKPSQDPIELVFPNRNRYHGGLKYEGT